MPIKHMKQNSALVTLIILALAIIIALALMCGRAEDLGEEEEKMAVNLPEPSHESNFSVEKAIYARHSVRDFKDEMLTQQQVSQLLWAAQGISRGDTRTTPSAGALYPLEIYLIAGNVEGLSKGMYHYIPAENNLEEVQKGDLRQQTAIAALGQSFIAEAPAVIIIAAAYERTTEDYGERGIQYVNMEAGHASQNIYLQATSLGLGTVAIGAFENEELKSMLKIEEAPIYIMPIGKEA